MRNVALDLSYDTIEITVLDIANRHALNVSKQNIGHTMMYHNEHKQTYDVTNNSREIQSRSMDLKTPAKGND